MIYIFDSNNASIEIAGNFGRKPFQGISFEICLIECFTRNSESD